MDISKIQMPNGEEYNIKDAEVRHMIAVLLGQESNETNEDKGEEE